MEAVITLHEKHSDRTKRAKSRIKFLVERFGAEGFVARYQEEFAKSRAAHAGSAGPAPCMADTDSGVAPGPGAPRAPAHQRQPGFSPVPIAVPLAHLKVPQALGLAALMRRHGIAEIRTTQDQNLVLRSVPHDQVAAIVADVEALGLGLPQPGDNVVACPGTSTCRLGITASQESRLPGWPNIAGRPARAAFRVATTAARNRRPGDIGIYGEGRRMHDRLVPHYQLLSGRRRDGRWASRPQGTIGPGGAHRRRRFRESDRRTGSRPKPTNDSSRGCIASPTISSRRCSPTLVAVAPEELNDVLRDVDGAADFKVQQLGGGECAGASQVFIGAAFFAAAHERRYRDAFAAQRRDADTRGCAVAQAAADRAGAARPAESDAHVPRCAR
jgi:hypothetical protein